MINLLEMIDKYKDSWNLTFYFVAALVVLVGILWTYYQLFIKSDTKKELKENIIYNHSEDIIESDILPKRKKRVEEEPNNYYSIENKQIHEQETDTNELNKNLDVTRKINTLDLNIKEINENFSSYDMNLESEDKSFTTSDQENASQSLSNKKTKNYYKNVNNKAKKNGYNKSNYYKANNKDKKTS